MANMVRRSKGAVAWHLPKANGTFKGRAFVRTTRATADLIDVLASEGRTWSEVAHAIVFDREAQAVAQGFIDAGFGATFASEHLLGHGRR